MEEKDKKAQDALAKAKQKKDEDDEAYNKLYISEMMSKVSRKIDEKDPAVIKALRSMMDDSDSPFGR
jgi:hypothetical protein